MSRIQNALVTAIAIILISCTWATRRVNVGEKFAMRPKEEVAVADTGITIRLNEVGHQTFPARSLRAVRPLTRSYPSLRQMDQEPSGWTLVKTSRSATI